MGRSPVVINGTQILKFEFAKIEEPTFGRDMRNMSNERGFLGKALTFTPLSLLLLRTPLLLSQYSTIRSSW